MPVEVHQAVRAGANLSLWEATDPTEALHPLRVNITVNCCIVGGGISGLSIAYTLARAGRSVAVIDDGLIGRG